MSNKITLYTDNQLVDSIKQYAKQHNTSVSKMVTQFFVSILNQEKSIISTPTKTSKLRGILKHEVLEEEYLTHLEQKYL
ncbi:MAG: hypothetical protein KBE02_05860 [Sulfurospirillum sp.]|nr:hypothetical protein [Sulfurospirillum sp.]